jgi:hypothetical protein
VKDPQTGDRISTGFIHFSSVELATEAMETLQGTMTNDGGPLMVSYARARRFNRPGFGDQGSRGGPSGGYGRGSYGGGNGGGDRQRRSTPPRWN